MKKEEEQLEEKPFSYEGQIVFDKKIELTGHAWKQRGVYVVCTSCPLTHAFYIGVDKELKGIDKDGMPIIVKRK